MSAEMTVAPTRGGLESLTPAQRDAAVTAYLVDARDRLALALAATGPEQVKAIKAEASVIAEMSRQVGVSKEIQADAQEMVRRAEFALGKAVKAGQESGAVKALGDNQHSQGLPEGTPSVTDFMRPGKEQADITVMSSVDPDAFDAALNEARAEGNVSRANDEAPPPGHTARRGCFSRSGPPRCSRPARWQVGPSAGHRRADSIKADALTPTASHRRTSS